MLTDTAAAEAAATPAIGTAIKQKLENKITACRWLCSRHNQWNAIIVCNLQFNTLGAKCSNKLLFMSDEAVTQRMPDYEETQEK